MKRPSIRAGAVVLAGLGVVLATGAFKAAGQAMAVVPNDLSCRGVG